jgi:uncharacterized protein YgbK (DUF1537 family)
MVHKPLLGCIADDFTGATDVANTLVRSGMRTVQVIGVPDAGFWVSEVDAVVVALKTRTILAADAITQSLHAMRWLRELGCRKFLFKYCSTFDSTDAGNIGPVTDALLDELHGLTDGTSTKRAVRGFTIACPAFPEAGRTVFRGHLFVGDALLSESGMRSHPLTPMTDSNLVRVLAKQTSSKVGLIRYDQIAQGSLKVAQTIELLKREGVRIAITDATNEADLHALGKGCADLPLITGGSAIATGLAANFKAMGQLPAVNRAAMLPVVAGRSVVLAGSASVKTNAQVEHWIQSHAAFQIDPLALARGEPVVDRAVQFVSNCSESVLVYATNSSTEVERVQCMLGTARAAYIVEAALSSIARRLKEECGMRKFVVAGGETSGAVVNALGVVALQIGEHIDPGVPSLCSISDDPIALALKSGNFGAVDFFDKALAHLNGVRHSSNS